MDGDPGEALVRSARDVPEAPISRCCHELCKRNEALRGGRLEPYQSSFGAVKTDKRREPTPGREARSLDRLPLEVAPESTARSPCSDPTRGALCEGNPRLRADLARATARSRAGLTGA